MVPMAYQVLLRQLARSRQKDDEIWWRWKKKRKTKILIIDIIVCMESAGFAQFGKVVKDRHGYVLDTRSKQVNYSCAA